MPQDNGESQYLSHLWDLMSALPSVGVSLCGLDLRNIRLYVVYFLPSSACLSSITGNMPGPHLSADRCGQRTCICEGESVPSGAKLNSQAMERKRKSESKKKHNKKNTNKTCSKL